jgi:hypothetical protein
MKFGLSLNFVKPMQMYYKVLQSEVSVTLSSCLPQAGVEGRATVFKSPVELGMTIYRSLTRFE